MANEKEKEEENRDMRIDTAGIKVSINRGEATLEGKVGSMQKKKQAEENAMDVAGVDKVNNLLEVEADRKYSDQQVHAFILAELANDDYLREHQLEVEVKDGKVSLHGLVNNYVVRKNIISIAQRTPGVLEIDNQIEVNRG